MLTRRFWWRGLTIQRRLALNSPPSSLSFPSASTITGVCHHTQLQSQIFFIFHFNNLVFHLIKLATSEEISCLQMLNCWDSRRSELDLLFSQNITPQWLKGTFRQKAPPTQGHLCLDFLVCLFFCLKKKIYISPILTYYLTYYLLAPTVQFP